MKISRRFREQISDFAFEIGNMIFEARLKSGITQSQLAKKMGTQQPSIARAERGASVPSLSFLLFMAQALGTSLTPPRFAYLQESQPDNTASAVSLGYGPTAGSTKLSFFIDEGVVLYYGHHPKEVVVSRAAQGETENQYRNYGATLPV